MKFALGDAIEEALKLWGIDAVPRDQRRKKFSEDVMRIYTKMQPQKTAARRTVLEDFI